MHHWRWGWKLWVKFSKQSVPLYKYQSSAIGRIWADAARGAHRSVDRKLLQETPSLCPILKGYPTKVHKLNGILPSAIGQMKALTTLYLPGNDFSGSLPGDIFRGHPDHYSFFMNKLSGHTPEAITGNSFELCYNQLTGTLRPTWMLWEPRA